MVTNNSWGSQDPAQVAKGGTGAATLTGVLTGNGTSAITGAAVTQYGVLVGDASNGVTSTAVGTATHVLTSNGAGMAPTFQAAAGGGMTWTEVTGTTQAAAVNNGYICNNASLVTVTLPATAAVGDIVHIVGSGAGLWRLSANTGDTIQFGNQATSSAGSLTATHRYDAVQVICIVANTTWACTGVAQGNLTVA